MARDSVKVARIFHASIRMSVDAQCVWRRMQNRKESNHHAASAKKHSKVGAQIALKLSRRKSRYVNFKLSDKKGRLCEGGGRGKRKKEKWNRRPTYFCLCRRRYFPIDRSWREYLYFHHCEFRITLTHKIADHEITWLRYKREFKGKVLQGRVPLPSACFSSFCFAAAFCFLSSS